LAWNAHLTKIQSPLNYVPETQTIATSRSSLLLEVRDHEDKVKKADKSSPPVRRNTRFKHSPPADDNPPSDTEIPSSPKEPPQEDATRLSRPANVRSNFHHLKLIDAQKEAGLAHFRKDKIWINKVASTKPSQLQYSGDLLIDLASGADPPLAINFTNDFSDWEKILSELMKVNRKEGLFTEARDYQGCFSTGGDHKHTLELLSKVSKFRVFIDHV
jgi:hypothetical protein